VTGSLPDEDRARWLADGGVAHLPPGARSAAIRGAIGRLAEDDPVTALHALAAALRGERDALIRAAHPDRPEVARRAAKP
jgi:hypothetical protein